MDSYDQLQPSWKSDGRRIGRAMQNVEPILAHPDRQHQLLPRGIGQAFGIAEPNIDTATQLGEHLRIPVDDVFVGFVGLDEPGYELQNVFTHPAKLVRGEVGVNSDAHGWWTASGGPIVLRTATPAFAWVSPNCISRRPVASPFPIMPLPVPDSRTCCGLAEHIPAHLPLQENPHPAVPVRH